MTDQPTIFRPEALRERDRRGGPGDVLRAGSGWTWWGFWVLLALAGAALVAVSVVEIDRYARGPTAVGDDGSVVVLLPVALAPTVAPGSRVEVNGQEAEVVASGDTVLHPPDVRQRYGVAVATPSVVVVTSARDVATGSTARVLVSSDPIIVQFVPGLRPLFGGRGG